MRGTPCKTGRGDRRGQDNIVTKCLPSTYVGITLQKNKTSIKYGISNLKVGETGGAGEGGKTMRVNTRIEPSPFVS